MEQMEIKEKTTDREFIATLAHDLKNPLLAQLRTLEMISENKFGKIDSNVRQMLDLVIESNRFLKELLFSTIENYKKEGSTLVLKKEKVDINKLTLTCINELKVPLEEKGLRVKLNSDFREFILIDPNQIRRVVSNLLTNAYSYAFSNTEITINLYSKDNNFIFEIETISPKITQDIKHKIFDKFEGENTGLGLYISKQIIEAHFGKIFVINNKNQNKFVFTLPY